MGNRDGIRAIIVPARGTASPPRECSVVFRRAPPKRRPAEVDPDTVPSNEFGTFRVPGTEGNVVECYTVTPARVSGNLYTDVLGSYIMDMDPVLGVVVPVVVS